MADISMCTGGDCPKKQQCYRFTATPNPWRQSYFVEVPFEQVPGSNETVCRNY